MNKQDVNNYYEQSVYEIRLRVAISLLAVHGVTLDRAFEEADKFVDRLLSEDPHWLTSRF